MIFFHRIKRKIEFIKKNNLIKKYNGQLSFDITNSIVISGVPRGGTTWFAELLTTGTNSSLIWEPLQLEFYPEFKKLNFKERQYINIKTKDIEIKKTFDIVLKGNRLTRGILQRTEVNHLINADYLITKFCRANRLLPWLTANFKFKKVIHIIRHPCAVIASQLKFGAWDDVDFFFTEEELKPDGFIENYYDIIKPIETIEEKLAAIWCLDNLIPLTQNTDNKWVTISYENLLTKPRDIFDHIGIELTNEILTKIYKPSSTTKKGSPITSSNVDIEKQLSYWKQSLTEKQTYLVFSILKKFKIDIYDENTYPKIKT